MVANLRSARPGPPDRRRAGALDPRQRRHLAAAVPLIAVPAWWGDTGRVFPATAGIASLNNVMLTRQSITEAWGMGGLVWLLVTAAGYLIA